MRRETQPGQAFAKTTRPTIGSAVERAALFARLDDPPGRSLIWVSGPPGAGKTTLVASYVAARRMNALWLQVDRDDSDPASFFHYLAHAARKIRSSQAGALPLFKSRDINDVPAFARRFFRELFAARGEPLTLVIDNVHAIAPANGFDAALDAGLSQVPAGSSVIVTSRGDPPAALARLRASGRMCLLDGHALRLDVDEIVAIAASRGQIVSRESAARLHERTHGWAAGVILMLEHAKVTGRIAEPPDAAPQVVFEYLAGEIFDRFEADTRDFLLRVACLPRMTASVAQALSGHQKAERLLQNLARNDYFVRESSSEGCRIYQLHPLLREFLRTRAQQMVPELTAAAWLRRAATLLEEADQPEDAMALLIEARDWDEVARLALAQTDAVLAQGRSETLAAWLEMLPPSFIEADPRLVHALAASRASTSPRAARQLFERAYGGFESLGNTAAMVRCCCGIVDAIVAEFDDLAMLDRWLEILERLLTERADQSEPVDAEAVATLVHARLLRDPGNARIEQGFALVDRAAMTNASEPASLRREIAVARAAAAFAHGDTVAASTALDALRAASELPRSDLAMAILDSVNNLAAGFYDQARRAAIEALVVEESEATRVNNVWLRLIAATGAICAGDREAARSDMARFERDFSRLRRGDRACVHCLRACLAMLERNIATAHHEAKHGLSVAIECGVLWFECVARIIAAQSSAAAGDSLGAAAQRRSASALAERLSSPWLTFAIKLAEAEEDWRVMPGEAALDRVRAAFAFGRGFGVRPPLGLHPRAFAELCQVALAAKIEPDFVRALVREGNLMPGTPPLRVREWPWRFRVASCGEFGCMRDDRPIELSAKGPGRPAELLKMLVALGGHNVRADRVADALWPHMEADYAYKSFTTTLHRLRRLLQDDEALILRDGRLSLNKELVWIDTWAIEQLFDDFDAALRSAGQATLRLCNEFVNEALALYRGPFLPDEAEQPAYIACREQLRAKLLRFLTRVARVFEQEDATESVADCYLRAIEADELCEPLYRHLMQHYERWGAAADAMTLYERLRTTLAMRARAMPSVEAQALYARLRPAPAAS